MLPRSDDTWSTRALFERALAEARSDDGDDHAYWDPIYLLRKREVDEVWDLVAPLAHHEDERLRSLVPDVFRALGGTERPRHVDTIELLGQMLRVPQPPSVIASIATAFVDLRDPAAVDLLQPYVSHPELSVRQAVLAGLLPVANRVVPELIEFSRDVDGDVRNWATFALGSQLGEAGDTAEVRDALAARLDDEHDDARAEAALGLAIRKDARALPFIRRGLPNDTAQLHYMRAATAFADERLSTTLEELAAMHPDMQGLDEALVACRRRGKR